MLCPGTWNSKLMGLKSQKKVFFPIIFASLLKVLNYSAMTSRFVITVRFSLLDSVVVRTVSVMCAIATVNKVWK